MLKWLHHLFNPHCSHCAEEKRDEMICDSCEVLKSQLALVQQEKKQLLDLIVQKNTERPDPIPASAPEPIKPRSIPWSVRKQMLEAESRERAKILNQNKLEDLEQQILESRDAGEREEKQA